MIGLVNSLAWYVKLDLTVALLGGKFLESSLGDFFPTYRLSAIAAVEAMDEDNVEPGFDFYN